MSAHQTDDGTKPRSPTATEGEVVENTIAAFGYEPAYRRVLGKAAGICIVIALAAPLGAIMVSGSYQIIFAGYWGLSWGWIIPNIMMIPQVIAVAELCSSMPVNGGFYWWAAALAPARSSRAFAFITGWFNALAVATSLAAFAYSIAVGMSQTMTIATDGRYVGTLAEVMGMSMGIATVWALVMLLRLETINIIMMVTAAFLFLSCLGFIIALPITHSQLNMPFTTAANVFGSFQNSSDWPQTGIAVPFCFYAVLFVNSTWTSPAYVAEETRDAAREAPRAIVESFAWTSILGLGVCLVFAFCINDLDAAINDPTGYPLFTVLTNHWGQAPTSACLIISIIFATIGGSGFLLTMSTQVAAFARDGGLPYSPVLSRVHKRTSMPMNAGLLLLGLTYLFLLLALNEDASDIVYSMASISSLIIWITPTALRLFAGDRWVPGPFYTGRYSWYIHLVAVLASSYFLITRCIPPSADTPPVNVVVVLVVLVVSIAAYFFASKNFPGLDLEALEAWRHENRHTVNGADFAQVLRQSAPERPSAEGSSRELSPGEGPSREGSRREGNSKQRDD
ncbi:amino acid permease-domain-containing protein [Plectosphaerella plurivora]|uniref:Amino acid permease-domain-containing protein n=1 Tax=Plectosphaerella plurivora TaxID=936078 RepID=A0A9P9AAE5_9PEZI|nr:amino acid permease-domain-containing protein [Plectosphaerella plurivora]